MHFKELKCLEEYPDIIITDYNMPGISGLQMCSI